MWVVEGVKGVDVFMVVIIDDDWGLYHVITVCVIIRLFGFSSKILKDLEGFEDMIFGSVMPNGNVHHKIIKYYQQKY